ncbi:hypothetical protein ID866_9800 [Astraeus odoratus]|nr:hypothetical protein ID866_9800 [Astraeus odoratus]
MAWHVNNGLASCNNPSFLATLKHCLHLCFRISNMGPVTKYLGILSYLCQTPVLIPPQTQIFCPSHYPTSGSVVLPLVPVLSIFSILCILVLCQAVHTTALHLLHILSPGYSDIPSPFS